MKNILKNANQVAMQNTPAESEITEEVELGETLKSQVCLMATIRPESASSTNTKSVYEGGDSAMELLEDGAGVAAGMGGKARPAGHGEEDPVTAFLTQVPPDWEKAELHGMANLVLNSANTKLDLEDPSTFCPCCQMPYP